MRNLAQVHRGIWIGALAVLVFAAGALILHARAGSTSAMTASYTQIGSVNGELFWAERSTQEGTAVVSVLGTGTAGTLCNAAGAYEAGRPNLICSDGTGSWTGFVMPVSHGVGRVDIESADGQLISLRVVPPPSGWPLGFAIGVTHSGANEVFTVAKVTCYGGDGNQVSC